MVAEKTAVVPVVPPAVAQLRGELMTLLAKIEDEDTLAEIQDYLLGLLGHVDMLEDMPQMKEKISKTISDIKDLYSKGEFISLKESLRRAKVFFRQKVKFLDSAERMDYLRFVNAMTDISQPITFHDSQRVAQLIEEVRRNSMAEKEWVLSKLENLREDADWNRLALEQFFAGADVESDSVYDKD